MLDHYFAEMAMQVSQVRHAELLALAEQERQWAAGVMRPARWHRRLLATLGARLIATGQRLERVGGAHAAPIRIEA